MRWTRILREFFWFGVFALLTAVMTWPWVIHVKDTVSDPGDPFYSTWALAWEYHQTFHNPLHLFDGNIFYPLRNTLAFTESMYGTAVPLFPLFFFGLRPVTVNNIAMLLSFALCGYGMFRLARTATGSTLVAVISGIIFAFAPFRFNHISHLMYTASVWVPLTLEALILFLRDRTWKRAIWLGVAYFFNGLSSVHWFVLTLIPLPFAFFLLAWAKGLLRERALWVRAIVVITVASLALVPFLLPYRAVSKQFGYMRSIEENLDTSAMLRDWLIPPPILKLYANRLRTDERYECDLFPGLSVVLLTGAAIFLARKPKKEGSGANPFFKQPASMLLRTLDVVAVLALVAAIYILGVGQFRIVLGQREILNTSNASWAVLLFMLSLAIRWWIRLPAVLGGQEAKGVGDYLRESATPELWIAWSWAALGFFGTLGVRFAFHRVLYDFVPLFRSIRPTRWANISTVGLALLAGVGAAALAERVSIRWRKSVLVAFLALAILFEFRAAPFTDFFKAEIDPPPVYSAIKELPMKGGLVELPASFYGVFYYTMRAADHLRPVVVATSSFGSPVQGNVEVLTQQRPIPNEFLDFLESIPTSYIVVHEEFLNWEDLDERRALHDVLWRGMKTGRIRFVKRYEGGTGGNYWEGMKHQDDLYAVVKNEPSAQTAETLPWLSPDGIPLDRTDEDGWILASIESPKPNAELGGQMLVVSGGCQDSGGLPCSEIHVLIDGEELPPAEFTRYVRSEATEPETGNTAETGYKATFLKPLTAGEHKLEVIFHIQDKKRRRLGPYTFYWKP